MTLLEWSEALALGIEQIDKQHKILLDIMNELNDQILRGKNAEGSLMAVTRLESYTRQHFADEEALMLQTGFPGLKGHKVVHSRFEDRLKSFAASDFGGEPGKALEMLSFLQDWLVDHILGQDLLFAHHYKAHAG